MTSKPHRKNDSSRDKALARKAARNASARPRLSTAIAMISGSRAARRHLLLTGVSIAALAMSMPEAHAKPMGGWTPVPTAAAVAAAQTSSAEAAAAAQRSLNALQRATSAIQAMQATQQAARDAAKAMLARTPSGIPDGLKPGGLDPVVNPSQWIGGNAPSETKSDGRTKVTVEQTQQRAVFTWNKFNVSENTDLVFNQLSAEWVALNRVLDTAPSTILGSVKAPGTVLVINQNGIVFGAGAQVNVGSLIATTLDVGPAIILNETGNFITSTTEWRNQNFLANGLLGYEAPENSNLMQSAPFTPYGAVTTSPWGTPEITPIRNEGTIKVEAGASITADDTGLILMAAPYVINAGHLRAPQGQVILTAASTALALTPSTGAGSDPIPQSNKPQGGGGESVWAAADKNIRGLVPLPQAERDRSDLYVWNQDTGLIEVPQGNIYLRSPGNANPQNVNGYFFDNGGGVTLGSGLVRNDGVLSATTSVSRNGSIFLDANDVRLGAGSTLAILPDTGGETIPQSPSSLADFRPSAIRIGRNATSTEMGEDALILAPGGDVLFGRSDMVNPYLAGAPSIVINRGAEINVAGLPDVLVPISENQIVIDPAKKNELRDSPLYRSGFLNGAVIYLDPRISGVRDDGVPWIGSPLIDATAYYQLVGVGVDRLMTKGGSVTLGVGYASTYVPGTSTGYPSTVVVREGAVIDMSGGWLSYEAGFVRSTQLITATGHVVDISRADPNETYIGIANGWTRDHAHWGKVDTWSSTLGRTGGRWVQGYNEGRDAGIMQIATTALVLDGTFHARAYAGENQIAAGKAGTGKSAFSGDDRLVQGGGDELPAGGALIFRPSANVRITADESAALPDGDYGNWVGGGLALNDDGKYVYIRPTLTTGLPLPAERLGDLTITDKQISDAGLSQLSILGINESGAGSAGVAIAPSVRTAASSIRVEAGANIVLNPGGIFRAEGSRVEIDGNVTVPAGRIVLRTAFHPLAYRQPNSTTPPTTVPPQVFEAGYHDIIVNGRLSVAGRWVNDYGASNDAALGPGWLNGGSITMEAASRVDYWTETIGSGVGSGVYDSSGQLISPPPNSQSNRTGVDLSGSILINPGARLDLSGGGRIDQNGKFDLTGKGGSLSLKSGPEYFYDFGEFGIRHGWRLATLQRGPDLDIIVVPVVPEKINARIVFDRDAITAHGFGGGGTFNLYTPEFSLGEGTLATGTILPFDFFSTAGFANYNITSFKTEITPSTFTNGYGGYNAVLATQTITVGAGQTLLLTQSVLPNLLDTTQALALRGLASGGDIRSVLSPAVPTEAWDQKPVNLTLGGLMELHVAEGGAVTGAAGASLTVGGLINDGTIRIAGGTVTQRWDLPSPYVTGLYDLSVIGNSRDPIGFRDFSDIFTINPDGSIDPTAPSKLTGSNQDLIASHPVYKLGLLDQGEGIRLGANSVIDLSGAVILNPYASPAAVDGRIVGGGTLATVAPHHLGGWRYELPYYQAGGTLTAAPGAVIDLSGASGVLRQPTANGYAPTEVWSNGGTLSIGAGATLDGIDIRAHGGNVQARGGTLQFVRPVLAQHDPATSAPNVVSADFITRSGFDTLIAMGGVTSSGDATVTLDRAFILMPQQWKYDSANPSPSVVPEDILSPTISTGGALTIEAPYIGLLNNIDRLVPATGGTPAGTVTLRGRQIDVTGVVRFDASVTHATLDATGDMRLIGVDYAGWYRQFDPSFQVTDPTLTGAIAVRGDLTLNAAQIYPTTGSTFTITSAAADGTITIGRNGADAPPAPYTAGGNLTIQAAHIVQGGVIRVPFGTLTLGGNEPMRATSALTPQIAPATQSVVLADGSITSVSAGGLSIPYGTTTDTIEWYFAPTSNSKLDGPPVKVLALNGKDITLAEGATVDLSGGGDVYAYEFVPGTGGSRDVLSQFNADQYSANVVGGVGYQYPDRRQVYAIVPGLSDAPVSVYDPIYSANYASLISASGAGRRVWLDGGNGLAAGWYTLLPAQYAMLPGGMRVVEQVGTKHVIPGSSFQLGDGSLLVSGRYGDALSGASDYQVRQFSVMSQDVIRSYSNIVLTSGNEFTLSQAASQGLVAARNGLDAGRLVFNPLSSLTISATVLGTPADGGRGSQVDIGGNRIVITSTAADAVPAGVIHLTAESLNKLNAESLLIGATRTDNTDGTTNLTITGRSIVIENDAAHPLTGPEILFAVDDGVTNQVAAELILRDGATVIATGAVNDQRSGAYVIDGRVIVTNDTGNLDDSPSQGGTQVFHLPVNSATGALVRVANGPQRIVERLRTAPDPVLPGATGTPTGPDASLLVGNVTLQGGAIGFDTSHAVSIGSNAQLRGRDIALGAAAMAFTRGAQPSNVVVITPELQAILSQGDQLTLRSQSFIGFDNGTYQFKSVALDAATLESLEGGSVTLNADKSVQLSNAGAAGAVTGGTGTLNIVAGQIGFGSGTMATAGFGNGVHLTAREGLFSGRTPVNAAIAPVVRYLSPPVAPPDMRGVFDIGAANLSIVAPYIGDAGTPGVFTDPATSLTLRTTGNVAITSAGTSPIDLAPYPGIPGSSIIVEGNNVTVSGTTMRATAGTLTLRATGAIALSGGARLETPGYSQTFGDQFDPQTKSALGGTLTLSALGAGGISLGDATLSVGNGTGDAGTLKLSTANGSIDWGSVTLDGKGGDGGQGGTFSIDTKGGIDLVAINTRVGADGFTGGFMARTRTGNIELTAGQTLRSGSVNLTADGGFVIIGGTIDTSGVNGGNIELYGTYGVTLQGGALLDSHADGYAADDTRQARAGHITLGTDFLPGTTIIQNDGSVTGSSGVITIASGARIDASAHRPGDRLVRIMRGGVVNYAYVEGDLGGIVTLRAPVVAGGGGNTVNVSVASADSIAGARSIDLVGFKRWDLAQVAASGLYTGVTRDAATNTVSLDVTADLDTANVDGTRSAVGGVNFLGDNGTGTIVDFVQNLDVSAAYGNLGGLAARENFRARPGIDLAATGNIVLNSNWNLGAGTVNLQAALAAGSVILNPMLQRAGEPATGYVIKSGSEGKVFAENTTLIYRTNHGDVNGEAPVLSLRAGGAVTLKGSLTDGFFMFRDQTDRTYRQALNKTYSTDYVVTLNGGFNSGSGLNNLTEWSAWTGTSAPQIYLGLSVAARSAGFLAQTALTADTTNVPYSTLGNSPAAQGTYRASDGLGNVDGGGDPLGSAVVFPLLPGGKAAPSTSYMLVAGAAGLASGSVLDASADPFRINPASAADLTVIGRSFYQPPAGSPLTSSDGVNVPGLMVDNLNTNSGGGASFSGTTRPTAGGMLTLADWLAQATNPAAFRGVSDTSVALLYLGRTNVASDDPNRALVLNLFAAFAAEHGLVLNSTDPNTGWRRDTLSATDASTTFIAMSVKNFKLFVAERLIPAMPQIEANLRGVTAVSGALPLPAPTTTSSNNAGAATMVRTMVRSGTGSIRLGAGGDLDLTDGPVAYVTASGTACATPSASCSQLGGVAVYTAGHLVAPVAAVLPDPVTGAPVAVATPTPAASIFATPFMVNNARFNYGGALGTLAADAVALTGGGDIDVTVQGSVLSRRDLRPGTLAANQSTGWTPVHPWFGMIVPPYQQGTIERGALPEQPWRRVDEGPGVGGRPTATISTQLFREGIGALGGGNVTIDAGHSVSDITVVSETSLASTTMTPPGGGLTTSVLFTFGGGNVAIRAGGDILAARVDVPAGTVQMTAGGNIGAAAPIRTGEGAASSFSYVDLNGTPSWQLYAQYGTPTLATTILNETRVRIDDATVDMRAGGDIELKGIAPLDGFYSPHAALHLSAGGSVTVNNNIQMTTVAANGAGAVAVYPGTLSATALTGDVNLKTYAAPVTFKPGLDYTTGKVGQILPSYNVTAPVELLMAPSPHGQLHIMAGGDILPSKIAMLDIDPNYLPGLFTLGGSTLYIILNANFDSRTNRPYQWDSVGFPRYKSTLSVPQLKRQHVDPLSNPRDNDPVYILAGGDIGNADSGLSLSLPKQARVYAGNDIVNMIFLGQNLDPSDMTRVVAGRDIIGTSSLVGALYLDFSTSPITYHTRSPQPTMLGNTFILGGPGDLSVEAGRNLGPFLNSADIYDSNSSTMPTLRYGGGIITVGNEWNPYLPAVSANITATFGTAKGADYAALRDYYVAPGAPGNALGDYGAKLLAWMKKNAAAELKAAYGTAEVSADDAYATFLTLSGLRQRPFLLDEVYFNELRAPADSTSESYLKYSRGYTAVNTLFPASLGYTENGLDGGAKSDNMVHTGDLDLRLATIETLYGGNVTILGPGGRVLAGSVVATSAQIERRNYVGLSLFKPVQNITYGGNGSYILAIPPGFEGVLTQRGGFINTFTDGDFLLNQSRLFTVSGGDITMWSSNADLNGGQGAKTTPNFPPVVVRLNEDMIPTVDRTGATTGAGIATFPAKPGEPAPNVYLLAPRGTVDAGDAGVRSAGDISVAALTIANADNFRASGNVSGLPTLVAPNIGGLSEASNAAGQAAKQMGEQKQETQAQPSIIIVEVLGFGGSGAEGSTPTPIGGGSTNNNGQQKKRE
ncbi:filamentous haemagglutinin family protein [Pseudorhodoplanes sp.]|uniref:filamentous haemagglutinin family protein n=1 Tax=Pseudorhodoplanes sp. TaxID=1934341 RepID=UPI002BED0044|nr:filamentous haemagglutinin family protein [Pseudorhodoplanes sp.]HWV51692.1 filamentous hemagglutinin family protein [Pseudorhodoplanes sp.]